MKTKQQKQQEKRLRQTIRQAGSDRAELKSMPGKAPGGAKAPPPKKAGGFTDNLLAKISGRADRPRTAQQSIPYRQMYRDGVCRIDDRHYSKTVAFDDITYQLAQNEEKTQIFESYCDWLNYFDSSISLQLSFINQPGNLEEFQRAIDIPDAPDAFNAIRREYAGMIKSQMAKGNNGLVKTKYATFTVEAGSLKEAKMRLERIEAMVNIHIRSIDQAAAIKAVKRKLSDLDRMRIEEQKRAVRSGYDMDVLPPDLVTYGKEAQNLLTDLQSRNERMFLVTIIIVNTAKTKQKLDSSVFAASGIAQKFNCALKRLDFLQEQGFMSSLPLGYNGVEIQRGLTTSSTAIFVPFTTQELFQSGEALYYGLNALSNNLIMADHRLLKNPKGLYNQGRICDGKNFRSIFKKDFRKPMLRFLYMKGHSSARPPSQIQNLKEAV